MLGSVLSHSGRLKTLQENVMTSHSRPEIKAAMKIVFPGDEEQLISAENFSPGAVGLGANKLGSAAFHFR